MNKKHILIYLVFFVISGCMSGKVTELTKDAILFPDHVLEKITMPDSGNTIRATANITVDSHEGKYSGKIALVLKMPSCLHIETVPVFGPADFFLSANGESLKVFLPGEGKFYVGRATRENLFLFFKIFLPLHDMVHILAGLPPQAIGGSRSEQIEGGLYRVDTRSEKRMRSLWVDPDTYTLTKIEDSDGDRVVYRVTFKDHIVVDGVPYPKEVRMEWMASERVCVAVRYLDLDVVPDGDTGVFDLKTPPGITPVLID
ncbi:MAG TPA: hypothetical protein PLA74_10715 [Syntrophales bacterium]|nr:hypothetical protein [Syntrophales bacterium]HPQ44185.1 hypothetical protein [Syntrophales bacterium]